MSDMLMKVSELAKAAGVSKQTIHFYLREGLLSPPVQSSRNMAYYDARHLEEIRLIKELQEQRYLPLAVIKLVLEGRRSGRDLHLPDHIALMEDAFLEAKNEKDERPRTLVELMDETGLSGEVIAKMEAIGLLSTRLDSQSKYYDGYDAAIAMALGRLLDMGIEPDDLRLYGQILEINRAEIQIVHDRIIHRREGHPDLKDINSAVMNVRSLLAAKVKREFFIEHPQTEEDNKELVQ
ncbi:MAG: MerR family transcriptional regulator [Syntrophomonadaceae bacterium]